MEFKYNVGACVASSLVHVGKIRKVPGVIAVPGTDRYGRAEIAVGIGLIESRCQICGANTW